MTKRKWQDAFEDGDIDLVDAVEHFTDRKNLRTEEPYSGSQINQSYEEKLEKARENFRWELKQKYAKADAAREARRAEIEQLRKEVAEAEKNRQEKLKRRKQEFAREPEVFLLQELDTITAKLNVILKNEHKDMSQLRDVDHIVEKVVTSIEETIDRTLGEQHCEQLQHLDSLIKANSLTVADIEHAILSKLATLPQVNALDKADGRIIINRLDAVGEEISRLKTQIRLLGSQTDADKIIKRLDVIADNVMKASESGRRALSVRQQGVQSSSEQKSGGWSLGYVIGALILGFIWGSAFS